MSVKITLTRPDGRVLNGRVARIGDVLELPADQAAEILAAGDGFIHIRMRLRKGALIGSTWREPGAVVDVHPDFAKPDSHLASVLDAAELRVVDAGGILVGSKTFTKGKTFAAGPALATQLIGTGRAEWAIPADDERPPTPAPAKRSAR